MIFNLCCLFQLQGSKLGLIVDLFFFRHQVESADFHVDKTVAAAPGSTGGTEVALEVTFEPSRLGEQRSVLSVASPLGGEYTFPLFGTCLAPKPQGPFIIKAGGTTHITFRNVFASTTSFVFQVNRVFIDFLGYGGRGCVGWLVGLRLF